MTKCFTKFFWRKFLQFWIRCWFSRFFALKVFSKFFSRNRKHGVYGGFGAFFCSGCLSLGFPLEFQYISVLPPMILPLFFDHSSIVLRFPNVEWTEDERRMNGERSRTERRTNGARTEVERSSNGGWTELERRLNGGWTEPERRMNGGWTEDERRMNGARTELERRMNGARTEDERSANGGWTENDRKPNGERTEELTLLAKRSVFLRYDIGMPSELSSAKMERVLASLWVQNYKAKSKFSANLWCFENAERWKWKYKANNGSPVKPCVWLFE